MPRALHAPRPGDVTELTALLAQSRLTDPVLTGPRHVWHFNYTTAHRQYKSIQYDQSPSRRYTSRAALRPERNARLAARPAPVRSRAPGASHAGVRDQSSAGFLNVLRLAARRRCRRIFVQGYLVSSAT